jgi:hypothetical protein
LPVSQPKEQYEREDEPAVREDTLIKTDIAEE